MESDFVNRMYFQKQNQIQTIGQFKHKESKRTIRHKNLH